jgi:adenylate cyclase class 2
MFDAIMPGMQRSRREIEVKLRFDSPEDASRRLEMLELRVIHERHFEDNEVFDRPDGELVAGGKLLRLRRRGDAAVVTYKAPVEGTHKHKVREEHESSVDDPEAMRRVFLGLGYRPIYRYQKYRTLFEREDLHVCLDETPLGCFVELEGTPDAIDEAARQMGLDENRYVLLTYRELHEQDARERGIEAGDLVFDPGAVEP